MATSDGYRLQVPLAADGTPETMVIHGQEEPPQGWVSPRFGVREPAPVLSSRRAGSLPMGWVTLLLPASVLGEPWRALPKIAGGVDTRGAVVTLETPEGREL